MGSKGYVVRGKHRRGWPVFAYDHDGAFGGPSETDIPLHVFPSLDTAAGGRAHMVRCGCTDVAIFRVHDDGAEERLPSYEEALAELVRLRDQHIADRAEMAGAMAEMKECARALDEAIEAHTKKDAEIERLRAIEALNVEAIDASLARLGAVTGAIGPMPTAQQARCRGCGATVDPEPGSISIICSECTAAEVTHEGLDAQEALAALETAERRLLEAGGWTEEGPDKWSLEGVTWDRRDAVGIARYHAAKGGA